MSDQTYGTLPGGEGGGGTPPVSGNEVSAQTDSQSAGQELTGSNEVVTLQHLREMEARIVEEVTRRAQSMTDKMGSRLDKEIQAAIDKASEVIAIGKDAGITYTPEQEQSIRDKAINQAYAKLQHSEEQSQPSVSAPQEQGSQQASPWGWVSQEAQRIMTETGVFISPDEANKLIMGEGGENQVTPFQYVQAFEQLARNRQVNRGQPQVPPGIPSFATGGKSTESATALRQQYEKEMSQVRSGKHPSVRRGDIMGIQRIEAEYRNKGLDI